MNRRIGARTAGLLATLLAAGSLGTVVAVAQPPEDPGKPEGTPAPVGPPDTAGKPEDPGRPSDPGANGRGDELPGNSGETPAADRPEHPVHPEHPEHPETAASGGLPPAAPPAVGKQVKAGAVEGTVRVRLPGGASGVALDDVASLPVGTVIDAREGTVELTSAADASGTPQTARFRGGQFSVVQQAGAAKPVTELRLRGGSFAGCPRPRAAARGSVVASASGSRKVRSLWGSGHGRFRTKGRHSAATVRGTVWEVVDRCDGTLTRVHRGAVAVRDVKRKRTVTVKAGGSYLAKAAR